MASIKKETVIKYNNELKNNFKFDVQQCVLWNDKRATKNIELEENKILQVNIEFTERYENFNKTIDLVIDLSEWTKKESIYTSFGLGYTQTIKTGFTRKNFKEIIKESANWTDEKILELFEQNKEVVKNPYAI